MDPVPFSQARARLPELVHHVARNPGEVVRIQHRDLEDEIALVSVRHLQILEQRLAELRERAGPAFRLEGTMGTVAADDDLDAALADLVEGRQGAGDVAAAS